MCHGLTRLFLLVLLSSVATGYLNAQAGLCPPNLDFEFGDFTNWTCKSGTVSSAGNINTLNLSTTAPIPGRHTIIDATNAGTDIYGGFPQLCPNGSGHSVMLGNAVGGAQAESISYTYSIPSTLTTFSILFHYAIVLQDPSHLPYQQPRFRANIKDLSTNAPIQCVDFDFTAGVGLPGFEISPASSQVLFKAWTPITVNLSSYIGRTIQLEFITSDCTFTAHFGYAYVDVNTNCNGAIAGSNICGNENSVTLTAPYGFLQYEWYADNTFSNVVSNAQVFPISPAPTPGTLIPVIVTPYPGFGCRDTLYALIGQSPKPISFAGPDINNCKILQAQVGGPQTPGYIYQWTPAAQVSNPTASNPLAWNIPPNPQQFILQTTDLLSGCYSFDTVIVNNATVDTAISVGGAAAFCPGGVFPQLSVNNTATPIQWYDGSTPVPGATSALFSPTVPGNYWAELSMNGCTDSTATIVVSQKPLPLPSFTVVKDSLCVTNNSFQFTNTSTTIDNSALTYNWKFSDGTTQQVTDPAKTFAAAGTFNVELVAISAEGCRDSVRSVVHVMPNGVPNFTYDSICTNRPVAFKNLSNENGSPAVSYTWNFNNGGPLSVLKNPLPVTFTTGGSTGVALTMTTLGCENSPITITKPVNVNQAATGIRYPDITVPQGSSKFLKVRDIPGTYLWTPQLQLSNYNARYAEFYATGDDVLYHINIKDIHSCTTTDTLLVQVLKKPGYYLPTAFTPNRDGLNDVVRPYLVGMKSLKSFSIFNRWGDRIFFTTVYGEGWDGKLRGLEQNPGVYVWILEYYDTNNKLFVERGTLALIR
jgi:gliding motility-associated-like protein